MDCSVGTYNWESYTICCQICFENKVHEPTSNSENLSVVEKFSGGNSQFLKSYNEREFIKSKSSYQ